MYYLDYVFDGSISHMGIESVLDGVKLQGSELTFFSIAALVAHYYIVSGDDLECTLRRPATNHKAFEQLTQEEQVSQLRRMHTMTPRTKELPSATSSWYQVGIPKADALALLTNKSNGTFVVRSSAYPDWFGRI